jgi:hypothetical protein
MKSTQINFVAVHDGENKSVNKLIFDKSGNIVSARLSGMEIPISVEKVKFMAVSAKTKNANSITVWEEESPVEAPVKNTKKK